MRNESVSTSSSRIGTPKLRKPRSFSIISTAPASTGFAASILAAKFNVPFGRYKTVNYATDLSVYRKLFRRWSFKNKDLGRLSIEPDDFIYADPPYDDIEFTSYSAGGFSWDDQVRTAESLAKHRGPVLLSNQATKRIVDLYRRLKFNLKFLDAPRRISCNGNRQTAREVLAAKNLD